MSIQRFRVYDEDEVLPFDNGEYVTYADHLAAVAEAEQRGYQNGQWSTQQYHADKDYNRGLDAAREACIAAVEALPDWKFCDAVCGTEQSVIAAIDALRDTGNRIGGES